MNMKDVLCSRLEFYEDWNNAASESLSWALMCKWVWHFWCLSQKNVQFMRGGFIKKMELGIEIIHYSWLTFPPASFCYFQALSLQPSFYQVTHGQYSHCLFISVSVRAYVYVSTSNPALSSFCPLQAQCQQPDFEVKPQFIRLSLRTPLLST